MFSSRCNGHRHIPIPQNHWEYTGFHCALFIINYSMSIQSSQSSLQWWCHELAKYFSLAKSGLLLVLVSVTCTQPCLFVFVLPVVVIMADLSSCDRNPMDLNYLLSGSLPKFTNPGILSIKLSSIIYFNCPPVSKHSGCFLSFSCYHLTEYHTFFKGFP